MKLEIHEIYTRKIQESNHRESFDQAELRLDLFRGKWMLISPARGQKPTAFAKQKPTPYKKEEDVFRDPEASQQEPDTLVYKDPEGEWTTRVFPNKFPAVSAVSSPQDISEGPYPAMLASGIHEVLVTRDGRKTFALLEVVELAEVIDAYQDRYLSIMNNRHVQSITIFHNHGAAAGGSIIHPHSQIMTLPIVSGAILQEVEKASHYQKQAGVNIFELVGQFEIESGERLVYENEQFVVYCPFASCRAFEMRILPKNPQPYFERIGPGEKLALADALSHALRALYDGLNDPDYNYFIRTAPCDGRDYSDFSYYVEILPRTHIFAGFEAATEIDIVPFAPEDAAVFLRDTLHKQKAKSKKQ